MKTCPQLITAVVLMAGVWMAAGCQSANQTGTAAPPNQVPARANDPSNNGPAANKPQESPIQHALDNAGDPNGGSINNNSEFETTP